MNPVQVARKALEVAWRRKALWFFGVFVAGASAGGSLRTGGAGIPYWAWPLIVAGAVLALAAFAMHVLSEGALIDGARRGASAQPFRLRTGFEAGAHHFWRVLAVKAVVLGVMAVISIAALLPLLAVWSAGTHRYVTVGPLVFAAVAIAAGAALAFVVHLYALRFVVLEGKGVAEALWSGWELMTRNKLATLELVAMSVMAQLAGALAMGVLLLPAAATAAIAYALAGAKAAIIVGALGALPVVLLASGVLGAVRSSLWTIGFLGERPA